MAEDAGELPTATAAQIQLPGDDKLPTPATHAKLPPIPKGATVHRNLIGPRQPSTNKAFRLYVNPKTPFRSITTRVRKQLNKILRTASSTNPQASTAQIAKRSFDLHRRVQALQHTAGSGIGLEDSREVIVLGTGRAIEKVLSVAAFFQGQKDCEVKLRTTSVPAVDEVLAGGENSGEREETRSRMVSCLQVHIRLI
ncbi:hypothetical protein PG995_002975 [Apiospora arundinis]|uniref:Rpp20 subunit of nuclear RNase MRP and P-domain-containing protein n=1 Tax=Apiospora arundinis TaxID=335852 RepID=A0ABR2HTC6_9PEZI